MTDPKSWNPCHGCKKYSEGYANCVMFVLDEVHKAPEQSTTIMRTKMFQQPLETNKKGFFKIPSGFTLRVNMTFDTFLKDADLWGEDMKQVFHQRPVVSFYILTKRVPRIPECLPKDLGEGYENVDLNITYETQ